MSTAGTIILIYNIIILITKYNNEDNKVKNNFYKIKFFIKILKKNNFFQILDVFGFICILLLGIGNIIYFITSYFAYYNFELKIMEKLGAQQKFHNMYGWVQFQISLVKCDLGILIFLAISFNLGINQKKNWNIPNLIADTLMVLLGLSLTLGLNFSVNLNFLK